jgi:hypothetical protein
MKFKHFANAVIKLSAIPMLAFFAGCGKKQQIEKHLSRATPTPTPYVYKLGEPRPITLNVDKPLIVPAATPIPEPPPKR